MLPLRVGRASPGVSCISPGGRPPGTPRCAVLARGDDPPEPPECASRPRGGTSPRHRPLTRPDGRDRWAGNERLAVTRRGCPPIAPAAHPGLRPGVAGPVRTSPWAKAQFGAEDRPERGSRLLGLAGGGLGELGHPVHAVVVGDGQGLHSLTARLGDQFGGAGRPVEEAVGGVAVQFRPGHGAIAGVTGREPVQIRHREITAGAAGHVPGQAPLKLSPANRRIVPPHDRRLPW